MDLSQQQAAAQDAGCSWEACHSRQAQAGLHRVSAVSQVRQCANTNAACVHADHMHQLCFKLACHKLDIAD